MLNFFKDFNLPDCVLTYILFDLIFFHRYSPFVLIIIIQCYRILFSKFSVVLNLLARKLSLEILKNMFLNRTRKSDQSVGFLELENTEKCLATYRMKYYILNKCR